MDMNQVIRENYEVITNPILKILIGALIIAVSSLAGVVVWLFRIYRKDLHASIAAANEETKAIVDVTRALQSNNEILEEIQEDIENLKKHVYSQGGKA